MVNKTDSVLDVFEGLTVKQAKELRDYIVPILKALRKAIVERDAQKEKEKDV